MTKSAAFFLAFMLATAGCAPRQPDPGLRALSEASFHEALQTNYHEDNPSPGSPESRSARNKEGAMHSFILILLLNLNQNAVATMQEFSSEAACKAAGNQVVKEYFNRTAINGASYLCVEK